MARYTLTINFDDRLNEEPLAAELHASIVVGECDRTGFIVESSELIDHDAPFRRWQGGVDWLEWCQTEEANT